MAQLDTNGPYTRNVQVRCMRSIEHASTSDSGHVYMLVGYRSGRWELWARSHNTVEIPVLETTMIAESHWRRIKHNFLHH